MSEHTDTERLAFLAGCCERDDTPVIEEFYNDSNSYWDYLGDVLAETRKRRSLDDEATAEEKLSAFRNMIDHQLDGQRFSNTIARKPQ